MNQTKALVVAWIRTSLVPPLAGFILAYLTDHGITNINSTWIFTVVTIVLSGVWYMTFHLVEILAANPKIKKLAGIFLGYPSIPKYKEGP